MALLALLPPATPAMAQAAKPDCAALLTRFDALIGEYYAAGERAIDKDDPPVALEKARALAQKGDAGATVTMIGVGVALRGRKAAYPVTMVRQVCTFAQRNGHPLHVVACAYFNALNPLGDRAVKQVAARAEIARFEAMAERAEPRYRANVEALKACMPAS